MQEGSRVGNYLYTYVWMAHLFFWNSFDRIDLYVKQSDFGKMNSESRTKGGEVKICKRVWNVIGVPKAHPPCLRRPCPSPVFVYLRTSHTSRYSIATPAPRLRPLCILPIARLVWLPFSEHLSLVSFPHVAHQMNGQTTFALRVRLGDVIHY